jgi:hypothetical protein
MRAGAIRFLSWASDNATYQIEEKAKALRRDIPNRLARCCNDESMRQCVDA